MFELPQRLTFLKGGYTAGLVKSTAYRATEEGVKPAKMKAAVSTVEAHRAYLVDSGIAPEQVDKVISALQDKAGK